MELINYYDRTEISNSDIKLINKSLEHYLKKKRFADSEAMIVGKAFHCYILEPEKFNDLFIIKPEGMDFRSNANKAWRDEHLAKGINIIDNDIFKWFNYMVKQMMNHSLYNDIILGEIEVEKEILFNYDGIACRAKLDFLNHTKSVIIDYKTILDCIKAENEVKYSYASQAYFYQHAVYELIGEKYDVVFIFCEKNFPHGVKYIKASAETLDFGKQFIDKGIEKIKQFRANPSIYTGYSEDFIIV